MTTQFIALPVGQGDAFFLERPGLRVLVDGGKSRTQSVEYLRPLLTDAHLDVVICTHNDKDHAEGVRGLLESGAIEVGEVWLPGRWTDRLPELCRASEEFYEELAREVSRVEKGRSLEELGDEVSKATDGPALQDGLAAAVPMRTVDRIDDGTVDQALLDAIDHAESDSPFRPWWGYWRSHWPLKNEELWIDCVQAAERIRAIAVAARDLGARIRWFDYHEFKNKAPQAGGRPDLVPMNAVEIRKRRKSIPSPLWFLSLSIANSESLVFRSPPDGDAPGVLFTADSDLAFDGRLMQVGSNELVTSPHHGSEANENAYAVVDDLVPHGAHTITWVRSDGRFQSRPGKSFLGKQAQAACTKCRGYSVPGQIVTVKGTPGVWTVAQGTAKCSCQ